MVSPGFRSHRSNVTDTVSFYSIQCQYQIGNHVIRKVINLMFHLKMSTVFHQNRIIIISRFVTQNFSHQLYSTLLQSGQKEKDLTKYLPKVYLCFSKFCALISYFLYFSNISILTSYFYSLISFQILVT